MKRFTLLFGALLLGATSLLAQTNYTVTFSANYDMDSIQVNNTISGEVKMLYNPDNVITLQEIEKQNVAVATICSSSFLQQTANNMVVLNVETASQLNLSLYSANGRVIARYANTINTGTHTFQIGASAGVYVLVAMVNNQTSSIKISLTKDSQTSISEIATRESVVFLKSTDDIITFNEGDVFEFTGFYKKQINEKKTFISNDTTIVFTFEPQLPISIENEGAIKAGFSVAEDKQVFFSQGNLQYQASTGTWKFADNQYDIIDDDNANISETYDGWIDLFGWGTSGWNSGANAYQPYSISHEVRDYYPGDSSNNNLTDNYANADWGVYNAIFNGGNQAGQWRTLTKDEWYYVINTRANALSKKGVATVNNVTGLILLPDSWTLPDGLTFTSGEHGNYTQNTYSASEWSMMEKNGAVFLPTAGKRFGRCIENVGSSGYYWSSSAYNEDEARCLSFSSSYAYAYFAYVRDYGLSVRLVQDIFK